MDWDGMGKRQIIYFFIDNDDIQMVIGRKQPENIKETLTETEKDDIRNVLRKINRAGRTLVETE